MVRRGPDARSLSHCVTVVDAAPWRCPEGVRNELADRFFGEFVSQIYGFIGEYVRERQADGVMRDINPPVVVRAFLGMLIHHSLNNILWDKGRRLLDISNEEAAKNFAEIVLRGVLK